MEGNQQSLATFYKGWEVYQQHLVTAIAPLTLDQLSLSPAPHLWSVGMLARHIIATRVGWFHFWMHEGNADLAALSEWDEDDQSARSAAELVAGLEVTWQMIQAALARWTPADLEQTFRNPYPGQEDRPGHSRQWIIWHVLEHDMHHGGEMSFALGMHNVAAIDL